MRYYAYDFEVFKYDWLIVIKDMEDGTYTKIYNDNALLKEFMLDHKDDLFFGFNSKHYDQYIMKGVVGGLWNDELKKVNDFIINGGQGWQCPLLDGIYFNFNNIDIKDDMQIGLSLKAIEGHLGLNIEESEVSFDIDRPLTKEEIEETFKYCTADVDSTHVIIKERTDYLKNKLYLGRLKGLDDVKALSMTNAKLTALYLNAKVGKVYDDERDYKYRENLLKEYIQEDVINFFNQLYDKEIPDEILFSSKIELNMDGCPVTIGFGGIHGAIPNYVEEETENRIIRNYDVASYYPHLMTICGYTSRNIPDPSIYEKMLDDRMKAKKSGDKATANALKLVANTTYGAMLNEYNELYDPLMGRSVCISGQLYLLELSNHLLKECNSLKIVQLNTDGIMVSFNRKEYDKVLEITKEWQDRTGFELEEDKVKKIIQKDVNNYIEIPTDNGNLKLKGGYVVRGVSKAGAFNVNNNESIIAKAVVDYFVKGIAPKKTINDCKDILQFQRIAKASSKYERAYQEVSGEKIPVQKVNRIYASKDKSLGKIYKVKKGDGQVAMIEGLPTHCVIDNRNELTVDDIDKKYYIDVAIKKINDFKGIKENGMANKTTNTPNNIYAKLIEARSLFLNVSIKKSGKNIQMMYKFFELEDIVPVITKIFKDLGLVAVTTLDNDGPKLTLVNTENPSDDKIVFQIPPAYWTGNKGTTEVQAMGGNVTYYRRYLYMLCLDIVESDGIDGQVIVNEETPTVKKEETPAKKTVVTTNKSSLTDGNAQADELQIKQLKSALSKLRENPDHEKYVIKVAVDTKSFTELTKSQCATYMNEIDNLQLLDKGVVVDE